MPKVAVEVTAVITQDMPDYLQVVGSLQAWQRVDISADVAEHVTKILFTDGQCVEQGQVLFKLDDRDNKAQLDVAKVALHLAQLTFDRTKKLVKVSAQARQSLDDATANLDEKKALVEEQQSRFDKLTIRAPFSGCLSARTVDVGQYVKAGESLVQLVDSVRLKVDYQVPERYLAQLQLQQAVTITSSAYPHKQFAAQVIYIAPLVNATTRSIAVQAVLDNSEYLLKPGLFVQAIQQFGVQKQQLVLPLIALLASLDGDYVYRVIHGKAVRTPVIVDTRWENFAAISSGLQQAEQIVVAGQQQLKDGDLVDIVQPKDNANQGNKA